MLFFIKFVFCGKFVSIAELCVYCCKTKCMNSCDISDICGKLNVTTNYRHYTTKDTHVIKQNTQHTIFDTR